MGNRERLVEVIDMKKHYPMDRFRHSSVLRAVDGINLSIVKGETLGLVGESGCGKSTFGKLIGQLLSQTEGKLIFEGQEVSTLNRRKRKLLKKDIQYVFQDAYSSLNPRHKIGQILEEPLIIQGIGNSAAREKLVLEMLENVGISSIFLNRYIHELSGGQRQRIGIARSLIIKPKFLILDEPVSALDVSVQSQILNLLKDLQKQFSLTYLFISHDLNVVHYMSDRVAVMYLGKIVELSDVHNVYENPYHPYTQALVSSLPTPNRKRERIILKGEIPSPLSVPQGCVFSTRCPFATDLCRDIEPNIREIETDWYVSCHL